MLRDGLQSHAEKNEHRLTSAAGTTRERNGHKLLESAIDGGQRNARNMSSSSARCGSAGHHRLNQLKDMKGSRHLFFAGKYATDDCILTNIQYLKVLYSDFKTREHSLKSRLKGQVP